MNDLPQNTLPEDKDRSLKAEFDRSDIGSFHAFCSLKCGAEREFIFWEWMATSITKYDKNGQAITTRPSKSGPIHYWLMKTPSELEQKICLYFLSGSILLSLLLTIV